MQALIFIYHPPFPSPTPPNSSPIKRIRIDAYEMAQPMSSEQVDDDTSQK